MTAISLAEWGQHMDAGVTTYAAGPIPVITAETSAELEPEIES